MRFAVTMLFSLHPQNPFGKKLMMPLFLAVGIPIWKPRRDDKDFSFFDRCSNLAAFTKLNS